MKLFKKFARVFLIFLFIAILGFSDLAPVVLNKIGEEQLAENLKIKEAKALAQGDGRIIYGESTVTTPRTRVWTQGTTSWENPESSTPVAAATIRHVITKAAPTRDEVLVGIQTTGGTLYIQRWNGSTWSNEWNVTVGDGNLPQFDIAYERSTGDALVVYGTNTGSTNEIAYRIWNGSTWAGPTNYDAVRTSGIVQGLALATVGGSSNDMAMAWGDANLDLSANYWDGTNNVWKTEPSAALSTGLDTLAAATSLTNWSFDLDFEFSGQLLIAWGNAAATDISYVTRGAGSAGAWGSVSAATAFAEQSDDLELSADPNSDNIILVHTGSDSGNDMEFAVWNGSAFPTTLDTAAPCAVTTICADLTVDTTGAGTSGNAAGWLTSGAATRGIITYDDANAAGVDWAVWNATNGWTAQTDCTTACNSQPVSGDDKMHRVRQNPFNDAELMALFVDTNSDLFAKRLTFDGTNLTWSSHEPSGATLEATMSSITGLAADFAYNRYIPNTLTIGITAGSKVITVNSGDTSVYANDTSCSAPASCAAFTLNVSNTSVTIGTIKITETGTANATADLSQLALFYDTDGNYSNGVTGQYGATVASFTAEAATVSGSLALTPATTYYFYARFNASSTTPTYPKGGQTINFQIAANGDVTLSSGSATISGAPVSMAGTTTILPKVSSVSYGSGLSDGARSSEAITISGYGFGVAPGGSRANCAGAVDTGCVRFLVGGATTVADASISSWSNISISWTVSSALATLGGSFSLEVVSGSQGTATDTTYYIYPRVTGMTTCSAGGDRDNVCGTNQSPEYVAADTLGLIKLNGDHFGSTAGTITFTGGITFPVHSTVEGACDFGGWAADGTSVCSEVAATIASSTNSGTITLTRSDSKIDTIAFELLPRIASVTPTSEVVGNVVTIDGDHFCNVSSGCPASPPTSDYIVYFGTTQAISSDFVITGNCAAQGVSWSNSRICVKVPSGTPTGSQKIKVDKKATPNQESERENFTVPSTVPNDPADLNQYKNDGITQISQGGYSTSSTVVLKATSTASMSINMALEVEVKSTGVNFDETGIIQGPTCSGCTSTSTAVIVSGLSDSSKHWRARTKNTTTNSTSSWVCFVDCNINNADFTVDANAPAISGVSSSNVGTNSATINWSTDEGGTSQVQYNITGSFVSNCATNNDCTALDPAYVTSHNVNLSNLDSGALYYYRVRSKDIAGNESISSNYTFTTGSVTQPAKTTVYYAYATTSVISAGATDSSSFSIFMPETSASTTSAFLELTGLSLTSGINNVQVWVNSQTAKTYTIASNKNSFKIVYKIDGGNINIEPIASSTVYVNPSIDTYITSGRIVITYKYTPWQ